ncbi:MAG: hypothetical protein Ta2D_03390 [Rickettsiales bacterium]|nr:MAG: hypothetical protein Ta2D_03390 [Rickettsiales bacterium]
MEKENFILNFTIDCENVNLNDFADTLKAINSQYFSFLEKQNLQKSKRNINLQIKEVRKGSIEIDIVEIINKVIENKDLILQNENELKIATGLLFQYYEYLKNAFDFLLDKTNINLDFFTKTDLKDLKSIVQSITTNIKDSFKIQISCNNKTTNNYFIISGVESNAIQNKAQKYIDIKEEEKAEKIIEKADLELSKTYNADLSKGTDFGVVKEIENRPHPISFEIEDLREKIIAKGQNPYDYIYNVDIQIVYGYNNITIKEYKIIKVNAIIKKDDI